MNVYDRQTAPGRHLPPATPLLTVGHCLWAYTTETDLVVPTSIGPNWVDRLCRSSLEDVVHFLLSFPVISREKEHRRLHFGIRIHAVTVLSGYSKVIGKNSNEIARKTVD
jgi:hypothetical protein